MSISKSSGCANVCLNVAGEIRVMDRLAIPVVRLIINHHHHHQQTSPVTLLLLMLLTLLRLTSGLLLLAPRQSSATPDATSGSTTTTEDDSNVPPFFLYSIFDFKWISCIIQMIFVIFNVCQPIAIDYFTKTETKRNLIFLSISIDLKKKNTNEKEHGGWLIEGVRVCQRDGHTMAIICAWKITAIKVLDFNGIDRPVVGQSLTSAAYSPR